jgi:hypothetical protein
LLYQEKNEKKCPFKLINRQITVLITTNEWFTRVEIILKS